MPPGIMHIPKESENNSPDAVVAAGGKGQLFTRDFGLMTTANFADFICLQMLVATLPLYIIQLGGNKATVGMVASVMGITALVFRPLMGWLTDTYRRRPIILLGLSFHTLASVAYLVGASIPFMMLGRAFHGIGSSGYNTASTTYVADIAPPKRRAEGMGLFSATSALGQIVGPAVGFMVLKKYNFTHLFQITAGLALFAVIISLFLREKQSIKTIKRQPWTLRNGLVAKDALPVAWIIMCIGLGLGTVQTFVALFALPRGLPNPGVFFTVQAIGVLISRTFSGYVADRYGRASVLIPGILLMVIGLVLLPWAHSAQFFLCTAALYGIGYGSSMPTSMALLIDCVRPEQRGLASSTYWLGLDVGVAGGAMLMGLVSQHFGFGPMWIVAAGCTLLALAGLLKARPIVEVVNKSETATA